jgi:uncharacterized protein (TIGR03083 family)
VKMTGQQVARDGARSNDELVDWLASPGQCDRVNLGELMIHQQDVRRPLGLDRTIPEGRLTLILSLCLTRAGSLSLVPGSRKLSQGLRLIATDVDWSAGQGMEVRGTAEAILMAINGRKSAIDDLTGPGSEVLAARTADKQRTASRR